MDRYLMIKRQKIDLDDEKLINRYKELQEKSRTPEENYEYYKLLPIASDMLSDKSGVRWWDHFYNQ